jgi:hypothetical protein
MKMLRVLKNCVSEKWSRVSLDKNLSDLFHIKSVLNKEDALSPLLVNFALENSITRV